MLELRFIRENIDLVREKCIHRGMSGDLIDDFTRIDSQRLVLLGEVEQLKNRRNTVSKEIAPLKKAGEHDKAEPLIDQGAGQRACNCPGTAWRCGHVHPQPLRRYCAQGNR